MNEAELLYQGRWLRLKRRNQWEYAERVNPGGAVIVVAINSEEEVLFVEQFRLPIMRRTIEMPAGLVGDLAEQEDEDALESARRELEEETGYRAGRVEFIMSGPSSAGMSNEEVAFVRATELVKVGEGGGDETEEIILHKVPKRECAAWLMQKRAEGYSIDPKLYAGLYFIERDAQGKPWP